MANFIFIELMAIASLIGTWAADPEITEFLKHIKVIPDYLAIDAVDFLQVTYDSGVSVNRGKEMTPTQVKHQPIVDWDSKENHFYTLMMIHSGTPLDKKIEFKPKQFHHWLVVNIPGKDISSGDIISEYLSSGPSKGSGLHLYVFLLYKQQTKVEFDGQFINKYSMEGRSNFSVGDFATKYELGFPLAANYYVAQYDDYVPTVHAQIGY